MALTTVCVDLAVEPELPGDGLNIRGTAELIPWWPFFVFLNNTRGFWSPRWLNNCKATVPYKKPTSNTPGDGFRFGSEHIILSQLTRGCSLNEEEFEQKG